MDKLCRRLSQNSSDNQPTLIKSGFSRSRGGLIKQDLAGPEAGLFSPDLAGPGVGLLSGAHCTTCTLAVMHSYTLNKSNRRDRKNENFKLRITSIFLRYVRYGVFTVQSMLVHVLSPASCNKNV